MYVLNFDLHLYRSLVKNCPEFIRTSMLTFFHNIADDLEHTIQNLHDVHIFSFFI